MADEVVSLENATGALVERALETGAADDVRVAVSRLHGELRRPEVQVSKDPVVLAFVFEIARRIVAIEGKLGAPVVPPRPPASG